MSYVSGNVNLEVTLTVAVSLGQSTPFPLTLVVPFPDATHTTTRRANTFPHTTSAPLTVF